MPFNPGGSFSLLQEFGTGTPPNNDFPPQVGDVLNDIATALGTGDPSNPYLAKANNLSDVANITTSQQNLNLEPGVDIMAFDAQLTAVIRQNTQNNNYTLVATDAEKFIYHSDGTSYTWSIPSNANVPFLTGTAISYVNDSTVAMTVAIISDTLVLSPGGTTGTRTLAANGIATSLKVGSTRWFISGSGLT